jgi:glutamate 5-kinase
MTPELKPQSPAADRRAQMANLKRVVVKVGTNVLTRENGEMALGRIHGLIEELVDLIRGGLQVIVVSSGAITMGMDRLGLKERPRFLPDKQACAAIGQIRLMSVYEQAFHRFGIATAQVLLTEDDFANRVRYLNLRNTLSRLLEQGVLPIINENDTVSTSEIETEAGERRNIFGDNDRLSALVMSKVGADLLVLLSDVDGLYALDPAAAARGEGRELPIPVVLEVTPEVEALARAGSERGRGGMLSKLRSIKVALESGGLAVIANGTRPGTLGRILQGEEVGTLFLPRRKIPSRKRWLAYAAAAAGKVTVNAGARQALVHGNSSLLFAGTVAITGELKRGDVAAIVDESGTEFARGIVNYSTRDALPLLGKRSAEIAELAGKDGKDYEEFISRDNIVVV